MADLMDVTIALLFSYLKISPSLLVGFRTTSASVRYLDLQYVRSGNVLFYSGCLSSMMQCMFHYSPSS